jgi:hypothetical protein
MEYYRRFSDNVELMNVECDCMLNDQRKKVTGRRRCLNNHMGAQWMEEICYCSAGVGQQAIDLRSQFESGISSALYIPRSKFSAMQQRKKS